MRILVHVCCAPDAVYFLKRLREDFPQAEITAFFYDPNIHPYEEYRLRLVETKRVCQRLNIELYEGEYDLEDWLKAVKGLEEEPERGKRCEVCFDYRLARSVDFAKKYGATHYTTTLLMSPKKDVRTLSEVGSRLSNGSGIEFLALDYRKGGGTQEMYRLSKDLELYHQDYCGCVYALFKQKGGRAMWDLLSFGGRRPGSREERLFIKEAKLFAEGLGIGCKEWEFSFLNWKLLHASLRAGDCLIPFFVMPFSKPVRGILKTDPERLKGNIIYYNKGGVKVLLVERFEDSPLEEMSPIADPTFIVSMEYKDALLNARLNVELNAEISWDTSAVLLMGNPVAREVLGFPADTLQDNRGISFEEVCRFIEDNLEKIKSGDLSLAILGAQSLGRAGSRFIQERLGLKPSVKGYSL